MSWGEMLPGSGERRKLLPRTVWDVLNYAENFREATSLPVLPIPLCEHCGLDRVFWRVRLGSLYNHLLSSTSWLRLGGNPVSHQPSWICVTSSSSILVRKQREGIKGTVGLEQVLAELERRSGNASKFWLNEVEFAKNLEKVKYLYYGDTWEPRWALRSQCGRCFASREQMLQVSWHWWLLHLPWCHNEDCKV